MFRQSTNWLTRLLRCWLVAGLILSAPVLADDNIALWRAVAQGDAFIIMRHALAPGTGDPPQFKLNDCNTQRNLSTEGRKQAAMIGLEMRKNNITEAAVFSSSWCRCQDTAKALELGPVEPLPALNSFYESMENEGQQTQELRQWLAKFQGKQPLVLVTHQVNISALTGEYVGSGEGIVVRRGMDDSIDILGRLP